MRDVLMKNRKVTISVVIGLLLWIALSIETLFIPTITVVISVFYIFYTKEALNKLGDCIYYLVIIAPIIGISVLEILKRYNIIENNFVLEALVVVSVYFLVWVLVVKFGDLKVVKMATLILAQLGTAVYLIVTFILNFIPIHKLNALFDEDIIVFSIEYLGHDARKLVEISIQFLIYPIVISALITYLLAEFRQVKKESVY